MGATTQGQKMFGAKNVFCTLVFVIVIVLRKCEATKLGCDDAAITATHLKLSVTKVGVCKLDDAAGAADEQVEKTAGTCSVTLTDVAHQAQFKKADDKKLYLLCVLYLAKKLSGEDAYVKEACEQKCFNGKDEKDPQGTLIDICNNKTINAITDKKKKEAIINNIILDKDLKAMIFSNDSCATNCLQLKEKSSRVESCRKELKDVCTGLNSKDLKTVCNKDTVKEQGILDNICNNQTAHSEEQCRKKCFIGGETGEKIKYCQEDLKKVCTKDKAYKTDQCKQQCFLGNGEKAGYCSDIKPTVERCMAELIVQCPQYKTVEKKFNETIKGKEPGEIANLVQKEIDKQKTKMKNIKTKIQDSTCKLAFPGVPAEGYSSTATQQPGASPPPPGTVNCTPTAKNCEDYCKKNQGTVSHIPVHWTGLFMWICSTVFFNK